MTLLHEATRNRLKKWTRLIIVDSQAVNNNCNASVESKGFCRYKATNGIKRYLAVDTLGFPFFTHCTPANLSDNIGLIEMLTIAILNISILFVNIPTIAILLDHGYHINYLVEELQKLYPQIMTKIRFERLKKHSKQEKKNKENQGLSQPFQVGWLNGRMHG